MGLVAQGSKFFTFNQRSIAPTFPVWGGSSPARVCAARSGFWMASLRPISQFFIGLESGPSQHSCQLSLDLIGSAWDGLISRVVSIDSIKASKGPSRRVFIRAFSHPRPKVHVHERACVPIVHYPDLLGDRLGCRKSWKGTGQ